MVVTAAMWGGFCRVGRGPEVGGGGGGRRGVGGGAGILVSKCSSI